MKITYASGKTTDGIILLNHDGCIRVAVQGSEDVVEFTAENGMWFSQNLEPVLVEFAWDRHVTKGAVSEGDCICPKELASLLIQLLRCDSEEHHVENRPKVLSMGASYC